MKKISRSIKTRVLRPLKWKIKRLLEKTRHYIDYGSADFFSIVSIETSTACNRRCPYCPNSIFERGLIKNKRILETGIYHKIIDELAEVGYKGVISPSFYGEPLLDKRLPHLIEYTRKRLPFARIRIYTNGDFLTLPLYKTLVNAGINEWMITQHSEEKNENVLEVLEYQKTHPKAKICYEKINFIHNRAGLIPAEKPCYPEWCIIRWIPQVTIDYNGDAILCCQDYHSTIKFGNVKNERLIDIWKKPSYKKLRNDIERGKFKLPMCKRCIGEI